jgi:threonine/homoserine/homoserine lactone efflux protein
VTPALLFAMAFGTAFSGAVVPGPLLFSTVRWSARYGRLVGPLIVIGHAIIELPIVFAAAFGLGEVMTRPGFLAAVGLAGGAMLIVLGVQMLRGLPGMRLPRREEAGQDDRVSVGRIVAAGALTSVSNPYFPLWWATVGLNFIAYAETFGAIGYAVFYVGHILADLVWYASVAESMHHGRRLLSDRAYRGLVGACAVLLVGFGLFFGVRGWGFLGA